MARVDSCASFGSAGGAGPGGDGEERGGCVKGTRNESDLSSDSQVLGSLLSVRADRVTSSSVEVLPASGMVATDGLRQQPHLAGAHVVVLAEHVPTW